MPPRPDLARRSAAEGVAAFALVFAGCGAIVADAKYDGTLGSVGISLVFGLIIMVMVYATGHLSGAHINPAVTLAFTLSRHFPAREAAAYIAATRHKRVLQVGQVERFNPVVAAARELATKPQFFEIHRLAAFSPRSLDIDVVLDLMIHDLDLVLAFVKSSVAVVSPEDNEDDD